MFRWLSVAPLGKPVVPLVYWMLIAIGGRTGPQHARRERVVVDLVGAGEEVVPVRRAEEHDVLELGQVAIALR